MKGLNNQVKGEFRFLGKIHFKQCLLLFGDHAQEAELGETCFLPLPG